MSFKIDSFNVRSLKETSKLTLLVNDIEHYKVDVCCLQETHLIETIQQSVVKRNGKFYYFMNVPTNNRITDIMAQVFIIEKGQNFTICKLHDRVAKLSLFKTENDENKNSKTRKLNFINVYVPWKAEDSDIDLIYSILHNELKQNSKNTFICGDFNSTIASNHTKYPHNIGHFEKGILNNNGNHLTDLLVQNNLYATNTFFNYKLAHISTFVSNRTVPYRKNPLRKQIDYILAHVN